MQAWPSNDLPLVRTEPIVVAGCVGTATGDAGGENCSSNISIRPDFWVIAYSFSYTVICLLILVQVYISAAQVPSQPQQQLPFEVTLPSESTYNPGSEVLT